MPSLTAAPNRVVVRFPQKIKESAAGLVIPETSQLRPEFGEIVDVGEPVGDEATACARWLRECQSAGIKVPVSVQSGTRYWRETYESDAWLEDLRVYRVTELASAVIPD